MDGRFTFKQAVEELGDKKISDITGGFMGMEQLPDGRCKNTFTDYRGNVLLRFGTGYPIEWGNWFYKRAGENVWRVVENG